MSSPKRTYSPPLILMLKITFLGDFADKKRTYFGMCSGKRTGARFNNFKQNDIDEENIKRSEKMICLMDGGRKVGVTHL